MTDKGFFQEHGRLSSGRTKQITREVNRLCNEVRLVAGELVDAFGIPDAVLGAPIGVAGPAGREADSAGRSVDGNRPIARF